MKKLSALILTVILVVSAMLTACSAPAAPAAPSNSPTAQQPNDNANQPAPADNSDKQLVVGFSQMENNSPWRIAETQSIKDEAEKRGVKLVYTDAQSQTSKQISDVEDMIAQKVDYILLAPREFEGLAPALEAAKEAGIPVILIDRAAAGVAGEDYVTLIASDFVDEGKRVAEWVAEKTGGKANIVELTGTAGSSVAIDRANGFLEGIKAYPDMKIIASQTGDFARAKGQSVMENIIQAKGDEITAVYAHNDEMAIGAIQALKAAGREPGKDVVIASIDGEKDALKAIIAGELGVSVECNPKFGPIAFDTIAKLEKGEKVDTFIKNEDRLFDATNASQFVDEAY